MSNTTALNITNDINEPIDTSTGNDSIDVMIDSFDDMNLKDKLLRGIYGYGFEKPSLIQSKAIPVIINGHDVIAQSQSGTGKTGTFTIGTLQRIDEKINGVLEVTALFVDYIFREMTGKQARVLSLLLQGDTQAAAAKKIRKSQSTISKHVQSAGWTELSKLLSIYCQLFK